VVATGPEEDGDLEKKSDQRREARERRHSEIRSSSSVLFDPPHVNLVRLFILYPPSLDLLGRATSTTHRSIAAHMLCQAAAGLSLSCGKEGCCCLAIAGGGGEPVGGRHNGGGRGRRSSLDEFL
jgi:hypothetical protein